MEPFSKWISRAGGIQAAIVFGLLILVSNVAAAEFEIQVKAENGAPISQARVCLLLNSAGKSRLTDNAGRATISGVPLERHRLIVTKAGFESLDQSLTISSANFSISVELREGTSVAPPNISGCPTAMQAVGNIPVPTTPPGAQSPGPLALFPIRVTNLRIDVGNSETINGVPKTTDRGITLTATFDRPPAFFRLGETADFSNAGWRSFSPNSPMTYFLNATDSNGQSFGLRRIYFQAAVTETAGLSEVKSASVILAPTDLTTHTLAGAELQQFLSKATDSGYKFKMGKRTVTTTECPPSSFAEVYRGAHLREPATPLRRIFDVVTTPKSDRGRTQITKASLFQTSGRIQDPPPLPKLIIPLKITQLDEVLIFEGPALRPFWSIFDVVVTPQTDRGSTEVVSVSSSQSIGVIQQVPFRTIKIQSKIEVAGVCVETSDPNSHGKVVNFSLNVTGRLTSLRVRGPINYEVRTALPR